MPLLSYYISTSDADVEAGYPEFFKTVHSPKKAVEAIEDAGEKGIPLYRLTVAEYEGDEFIDSWNGDEFKNDQMQSI